VSDVLAVLTSPEAERRAPDAVLAVPLGSTEQYGPHLPLSTDTEIAVALADALARARPVVVTAPAVPYGASGEH
jgi:mycofactocin precursor peptide peptidase